MHEFDFLKMVKEKHSEGRLLSHKNEEGMLMKATTGDYVL